MNQIIIIVKNILESTKSDVKKFSELSGNMVDDIYMDEVGFNLHLTHRFGRAHQGQKYQQICPTQKGQILSLVVAIGREGDIAHDVT
jgi:hypothetical protein